MSGIHIVAICVATATVWNPKAHIGQKRLLFIASNTSANKQPISTANNPYDVLAHVGFREAAAALRIVAATKIHAPALPVRPPLTLA